MNTRFVTTVGRSPQGVFDFVADPANNATWQGPTESARWTSDDPRAVGSTVNSVVRFLGRTVEFDYEVTVWDPPEALAFASVEGSIPFRAVWGFEPDAEGGTEVTLDIESEIGGILGIAERLLITTIERQLQADINALTQELG